MTPGIRQWGLVLDKFRAQASTEIEAEFLSCIQELRIHGYTVGPAIAKPIGNGIWELRIKAGKERATLLFCFRAGDAIFLEWFYKKRGEKDPTTDHKKVAIGRIAQVDKGGITPTWTISPTLN